MTKSGRHQRRRLECPCGELLVAETEDQLVDFAMRHLSAEHPTRNYTRADILFMAF